MNKRKGDFSFVFIYFTLMNRFSPSTSRYLLYYVLLSIALGAFALFLLPSSSFALDARKDVFNLAGVDVDGNGMDEVGVMKNMYGDQDFFVYNGFTGVEQAAERSSDLWNIPSGNAVLAVAGIDIDGDGVDEVAVLRQDSFDDQNIYFYDAPNIGGQMMPIQALDLWEAPSGNQVVDIAGADSNGDGIDELLVLKRIGYQRFGLFVYSVPQAGSHFSSLVGYDEWNSTVGNDIISIAGLDIDGIGADEVAVLKRENGHDMNVYVYDIPQGSTWVADRGADLWNIPAGNRVVDIDGMDMNGDGIDELGVLRYDGDDLNFYAYNPPVGYAAQDPIAIDLWNIPGLPLPAPIASAQGNGWQKRIEVNLSEQRLYAIEGGQVVNSFLISSGIWRFPTPVGEFAVLEKIPVKRYAWSYGPGSPYNYNLPNVPSNMRFYGSYYLHGAYWHNNFGNRMSHGCVNIDEPDAAWLYDWSYVGLPVSIHN